MCKLWKDESHEFQFPHECAKGVCLILRATYEQWLPKMPPAESHMNVDYLDNTIIVLWSVFHLKIYNVFACMCACLQREKLLNTGTHTYTLAHNLLTFWWKYYHTSGISSTGTKLQWNSSSFRCVTIAFWKHKFLLLKQNILFLSVSLSLSLSLSLPRMNES